MTWVRIKTSESPTPDCQLCFRYATFEKDGTPVQKRTPDNPPDCRACDKGDYRYKPSLLTIRAWELFNKIFPVHYKDPDWLKLFHELDPMLYEAFRIINKGIYDWLGKKT